MLLCKYFTLFDPINQLTPLSVIALSSFHSQCSGSEWSHLRLSIQLVFFNNVGITRNTFGISQGSLHTKNINFLFRRISFSSPSLSHLTNSSKYWFHKSIGLYLPFLTNYLLLLKRFRWFLKQEKESIQSFSQIISFFVYFQSKDEIVFKAK